MVQYKKRGTVQREVRRLEYFESKFETVGLVSNRSHSSDIK